MGIVRAFFNDETGYGSGSTRDFFTELSQQIMRPETGLFVRTSEAAFYAQLNLGGASQGDEDRAVGSLMAFCSLNGCHLSIPFPTMFYARILGHRMTLEDIQRDEPLLYNSLNYILTAPEAELEDYPLTINGVVHVPTLENRVVLVNLKINSLIPQEADSRMNDVVFTECYQYGWLRNDLERPRFD